MRSVLRDRSEADRRLLGASGARWSTSSTIRRPVDPGDRRRHRVTLTAEGERHPVSASRAQKAAEDALFASLDEGQREQLRTVLIALRDGLGG